MTKGDLDSTQSSTARVTTRNGLGVLAKLVALITAVVTLVVASLALYFPTRQMRELESDLNQRAAAYCHLLSHQARSAVAFDDQETAREILESVAHDRQVTGIGLYTRGQPLRVTGKLTHAAELAGARLDHERIYSLHDRLLAVKPVRSLEGPVGTLVIELSKAPLEQSRRELVRASLLVGSAMLLVGLVLTLLIARSMTRRIEILSSAAAVVAAGDLEQKPLAAGARDEIGALTTSFNAMVERLRALIGQIRRNAQEEQTRLETLVSKRTAELASRNEDLRLVMDNVEQGFVTIDRAGVMSEERSRVVQEWFGAPQPGATLWSYLDQVDEGRGEILETGWSQVLDGFLPLDTALDQIAKRFENGGRHYTIAFRPIANAGGEFERALVVISDVTDVIARERKEQEEQENTSLFTKLLEDRDSIQEFIEESRRLVRCIDSRSADESSVRVALHTLKGNASVLGLTAIARSCHDVESALADGESLEHAQLESVSNAFARVEGRVAEFVKVVAGTDSAFDESFREELANAIRARVSHAKLEELVETLALEPVERRLKRAADQVRCLATRLGKAPLRVHVECERVRADRSDWQELWLELPHVLRNAIDHGLERPEERTAVGKPLEANVFLRAYSTIEGLVVEVEDQGRGIAWEKVETRARALGLVPAGEMTESVLAETLFAPGVTTAERVTETSGRGIGLAAIHQAIKRRGGRLSVESRSGQGTKFSFVWPLTAKSLGNGRVSLPSVRAVSKELPS
jgi:two-component system chemotaxis sensor kinase CheA